MTVDNKKHCSFVLSATFITLIATGLSLCLTPSSAFAQYEGWSGGDDVVYGPVEDRGEYKLSDDGKVFERYYGKAETFTIPDGVDRIGANAFYKCKTLKTVVVPNCVTRLTVHAFANCSNLEKVVFSETPVWIDGAAFAGCRSLKSIEVAEDHPSWRSVDGVVFSKDGKSLFIYPAGKEQEKYVVPDGVRTIGGGAFADCVALKEIVLPPGVRDIKAAAFKNCVSLKTFKIPDGVTAVNPSTFSGCYSLESVYIPWDVTSVGGEAFADCRSLTEIDLPDELKTLGKAAFKGCVSLKSVRIPKSVVETGIPSPGDRSDKPGPVFEDCSSLASFDVEEGNSLYRSIDGVLFSKDGKTLIKCPQGKVADVYTVPNGVLKVKSKAFSHCDSIESIVFSNGVKYIEDSAISDCARLKSLTLPNDYQRIEDESENKLFNQLFQWPCLPMLSGTNELASINVPEDSRSFKSIDGVLYDGVGTTLLKCPKNNEIENFVIPDNIQALQAGAFAECSALKTIAIHEGVGHIEENSFIGCSGLTAINVAEKNSPCKSIDGVLFMRNAGGNPIALVKYPSASDRESYEVPNTVKKICNRAFADSRSLKSVKIPEKVEEIGFGTFLDCDALESIDVDGNNPQYFSIDGVLFNEDRALLSGEGPSLLQYPLGSAVENYVVPEGVKSIDASAFRGCSALKSVKFSKDVAFYGENAFRDCSALATFEVDENNARFSANDGVLFSKDGAILYKCPMGKKADVYEVPEGVGEIGHRAFVDCAGLTSIKIPEGVKKLGREAFANCSGLKSIELPASVDDIPLDAFPVDQELTIRAPKGSEAAYFVKRFAPGSGLKLELIE